MVGSDLSQVNRVNGHAFEEWLTTSGPSFIEIRNLVLSFLLALFRHGQRGAETYPSGSRTGE